MMSIHPDASSYDRQSVALVYPPNRCIACGEPIDESEGANEGRFPVSTPVGIVLVLARLCHGCLSTVAPNPDGPSHLAVTVVDHLASWRWRIAEAPLTTPLILTSPE
jgi:hypothetical protein